MLTIKPTSGETLHFSDFAMIKLTGPNDAPLCNANAFTYEVTDIKIDNPQ
jgi:hypothetical protein